MMVDDRYTSQRSSEPESNRTITLRVADGLETS
jgi:hypothetical protein